MANPIGHLKTINKHRHAVIKNCFRAGIPLQGLRHDLSKYAPVEFLNGAKYYDGSRSPNELERNDKGYSEAWLRMEAVEMPLKYVKEMFCDRVAASKTYMKDKYTDAYPLEYFERGKSTRSIDPETSALLEKLLIMLRDEGEKKTFRYIRKELKKHKDY